jgi:hypothetical protein
MKIILYSILSILSSNLFAQNIGINNSNPQAALDLNGDLRLRSVALTLPVGLNNDVDLTTNKASIYTFAGTALNGIQISGFTGGVGGRMVTIFNNSTTSVVQLYDAGFSTNPSMAINKILTGTGKNAIIYGNGSVTMRYDSALQKWTIIASHYTDGLEASPSPWNEYNNNIYNTNTANIGIGNNSPQAKLDITGSIKITDGNQAAGKVLTSDATGLASWQPNTTSTAAGFEGVQGYGPWAVDCATNATISEYYPVWNYGLYTFGKSVSISGNYAAVGSDADSAYIYKFNASTSLWDLYQTIYGAAYSAFGYHVDIDNDYLIIGTPYDGPISSQGSASIYKNINGVWTFQIKLYNVGAASGDEFGGAVAIKGDYAIIGAPKDDDVAGANQGSASIYKNTNGVWALQTKFLNAGAAFNNEFGTAVDISNDYAIVGAPYDNYGSATIYKKVAGVFINDTKLLGTSNQFLGRFVSLSNNQALINGIHYKNISNSWIKHSSINGLGEAVLVDDIVFGFFTQAIPYIQSAKIYKKLGNTWLNYQVVKDPEPGVTDFGRSMAFDAITKRFIIGANSNLGGKVVFGKMN